MNSNHEEDEFVAVRVQDPRIQNEGSWNSYVDYKIFLHTNSKAFTAKTSCVRRRYSEFVWLKKKLQKNAGLVPVPDLPGKSFFSFSNEDFLERRRKGLQAFLDKVVHMTVCLSDSQLHLFLQTQLPVCHIQDCVQGHTPYSVTDAILTYASSNWGLAQAQEDDSIKEPSLTVSYESMESPAPHQPCLQKTETFSPELLSCGDSEPRAGPLDTAESQPQQKSSVKISQGNNHLEAVVECDCSHTEASFFLGDNQDDPESLSLAEQPQQRSCQIQTPVEVHSPMGAGFEVCGVDNEFEEQCTERGEEEENVVTLATEEKTVHRSAVCSEKQVLENHVIAVVNGLDHDEGPASDAGCLEELETSDGQKSESKEETPEVQAETDDVSNVPEVESGVTVQQMDQKHVDSVGTKDESDEDTHSLPSSNESIIKVSEEESVCDEAEDSIPAANGYMKTSPEDVSHWSEVEASSRNILDLQINGCSVEKEDISDQEGEDVQYMTPVDLNSTAASGDLTESGDFSILETSSIPAVADSKCMEQETLSCLPLDTTEEIHEVQVR
ncbi:sorting nexin-11 [Trachinotus anak]|uniref:sorting nexin-11 n=1 Tax=Trachinotus anak TaxID=443729 RepID=UPI0039F228DD